MRYPKVVTLALSAALLSGCAGIVPPLFALPTAPAVPPDATADMSFDIAFEGTTVSVYHKWGCSYSRRWSPSSGVWAVDESTTEGSFVRKLAHNKYLYVGVPSCQSSDGDLPRIVEFNLASGRPAPTLISAGPFEGCGVLENTGRVSRYRKGNAPTEGSLRQMDAEERSALGTIEGYQYEVLPVGLIREAIWSKYPDLSELLLTMQEPVTGEEFAEHFLAHHDSPTWRSILRGNDFPWGHKMYYEDSPEMSYAHIDNGAWTISAEPLGNGDHFSVRKKYRDESDMGEPEIESVIAFGKEIGTFGQVYDPQSRTIAIVKSRKRCF